MVVLRDAPIALGPGDSAEAGFFGLYLADHAAATSAQDAARVDEAVSLRAQLPPVAARSRRSAGNRELRPAQDARTLFVSAPLLPSLELDDGALAAAFPAPWRQEEHDECGHRLSFFHAESRHVVLRAKELRVLRPHGEILRTGRQLSPAETALTSTVWMNGVFHSMLTQGHVNINRFLSTVRTYLGLYRSHGQRVFVELDGAWHQLGIPSAFEMAPEGCRWLYRHARGLIELRSEARSDPDELTLSIAVRAGEAVRFLISHHVALNGDDGAIPGPLNWTQERNAVLIMPRADSELGRRFPQGRFAITFTDQTRIEKIAGDELLFLDGSSRAQPYLCVLTAPSHEVALSLRGELIVAETQSPLRVERLASLSPAIAITTAVASMQDRVSGLGEIAPWFAHDALVHYLAPRGLEQFSGGGWGTRDVCQGPVELLLALGRTEPIRDIVLRVMRAQNPDGDWPQWFSFFERERDIRADDSHGDIALWPLVVLGQYLMASGDAQLLDVAVPFFDRRGSEAGESASVWQHAQRALALSARRTIPGTSLAAYGHGDWNDSLQPADPRLREHLCSAWTVTLQVQALRGLARALSSVGRAALADGLESRAQAVQRDFARLLLIDGVVTGYALFEDDGEVVPLLHPKDSTTGIHYSSLAMIHAILEDMLTPDQARAHLRLIERHLSGPDGARLFDQPLAYHGGPQRLFQRAESATFFGREIGLMYMHAHLRYAQALARMGEAESFFEALCRASPIGVSALVPSASLRQANCYFSSSDAAFADRYQASAEYGRVRAGTITLDGGWRVYSSGAGIALGLIVRQFLGVSCEVPNLALDPVMPAALDGMSARMPLYGRACDIQYRVGRAGCGVQAVRLNGAALDFQCDDSPYRRGAARITSALVREHLQPTHNLLQIELG
jgi:cellobiose phosphorylase